MGKPRIFIGSSSETLEIVRLIEKELIGDFHVEPWVSGLRPSQMTLTELVRQALRCDFGIFVLGRDDRTESRGAMKLSPRDNVVYEAGLFSGRIGVERTFYVVDGKGTKLPSDWEGLGYTTYDLEEEGRDAVARACSRIRDQMRELLEEGSSSLEARVSGYWWQFVTNRDEGSVVALFELADDPDEAGLQLVRGIAWTIDGKRIAEFKSHALSMDRANETIHYSWTGTHPDEPDRPEFWGIGEIEFRGDRLGTNLGRGRFVSTRRDEPEKTVERTASYRRATSEEVETMHQARRDRRKELLARKLGERDDLKP